MAIVQEAPNRAAAAVGEVPYGKVVHRHRIAARQGRTVSWPEWVPQRVRTAYASAGVVKPWAHQAATMTHLWAGRHVAVATGTGSGKSLPPVAAWWSAAVATPPHWHPEGVPPTMCVITPTKALAADQHRALDALVPQVSAVVDGDAPAAERDWARRRAAILYTNPDMLHVSLLPGHARWQRWLRGLMLIVIDEGHVYSGVFGSHVAHVLRRLRRLAAIAGASPRCAVLSATSANPTDHAAALTGCDDVLLVADDASAHAAMEVWLWQPGHHASPDAGGCAGTQSAQAAGDAGNNVVSMWSHAPRQDEDMAQPTRTGDTLREVTALSFGRHSEASTTFTDAVEVLQRLVGERVPTLAFTQSRVGAEQLALHAQAAVGATGGPRDAVAAYRGGLLPEERRQAEAKLRDGRLIAVATTSALELGVDVSALEAVLVLGWPGSRAAVWQRVGRAGRGTVPGLGVLIAREDPLDQYVMAHPEVLFAEPVEAVAVAPDNPHVAAAHAFAAAAEHPLTRDDVRWFGEPWWSLVSHLTQGPDLRERDRGVFWVGNGRPAARVSLRGASGSVAIIEDGTGQVVGEADAARADAYVHEGAVYVHQGVSYVVAQYEPHQKTAWVQQQEVDYTTRSVSHTTVRVLQEDQSHPVGPVQVAWGTVQVTTQVTEYDVIYPRGNRVDRRPLTLPERSHTTKATWCHMDSQWLAQRVGHRRAVEGTLHAVEHACIGVLPLLATCDRRDLGGLSTAVHQDTLRPTFFVYEAAPGGVGLTRIGFDAFEIWWRMVTNAVTQCPCETGCLRCVQSASCGNRNDPLTKDGALALLHAL